MVLRYSERDGQTFKAGKMANAMGRRLDCVTCWQLELQKGRSGEEAGKIHRSIL